MEVCTGNLRTFINPYHPNTVNLKGKIKMIATVWEGTMSEASMKGTLDGVLAIRVWPQTAQTREWGSWLPCKQLLRTACALLPQHFARPVLSEVSSKRLVSEALAHLLFSPFPVLFAPKVGNLAEGSRQRCLPRRLQGRSACWLLP